MNLEVTVTYVQRLIEPGSADSARNMEPSLRHPLLLIVEDGDGIAAILQPICDFLDIAVERLPSEQDLTSALRDYHPMGLVVRLDCQGQDGYYVMMTVAQHDRSLPILLLTGDDPALAGAADAVEELWKLEAVVKFPKLPSIAAIVDFIFRAGRKGRCTRLMPV
jgi:ActR/RegA family two-component response regulator